jgi:tetratricopeptide (TPR) repeat protein
VQVGWEETVRFLEALESAEATEPLAAAVAALVRLEPPVAEAVEWASRLEFRWLADAVAAELRGDDVGAAALYLAVLTVRPANREASSSMGRLKAPVAKALREAQAANDADAIVAAANRLLTLDPRSTEAEFALGRLHLVAGRPEEALVHLRRAVEGADSTVWHHLNLGRAAMACQRYEEALAAFRRIVESGADPAHAYVVEAANSIEKLYRNALSLARKRLAERAFEESWKLLAVADAAQPGNGETAAVRGTLERRMYSAVSAVYKDRPEAARPEVEAFLRLFPDNDRALVMHGRLAMKERDYAAALSSWSKIAAAVPDDAVTHLQVARCHAWLKSAEPAVEAARRALALDPGLDEAKGIIDRFASA